MSGGARRVSERQVIRASLAVVAALALTGVGLFWSDLKPFGSDEPASVPSSDTTRSATPSSATPSATTSPASSPTASKPRVTAARMTAFLQRYLATAPRNPRATWRLLTSGFQRASNGYRSYADFWGPIDTARPSGIFADPETRRITYRVRYTYPDGHTFTDNTRLELRPTKAGALRIAGEG